MPRNSAGIRVGYSAWWVPDLQAAVPEVRLNAKLICQPT
jgi:hypothetical protein